MLHSYLDWNEEEHLEIGVVVFQETIENPVAKSLLWGPRSGFFVAHNDRLSVPTDRLIEIMWVDKWGSTPENPRIHTDHFPAGSLAHYKGGIFEVLGSDLDFVFLKTNFSFLAVSRKFDVISRVHPSYMKRYSNY